LTNYNLTKKFSQFTYKLLKVLPTGGKSYPGYLFIKYAGLDSIKKLANEQLETGSILITGTNGKTTTTTMLINLLSNDTDILSSVDNNTIYALTTALLSKKANIGVFEYGIRDIEHGIPDKVQKYVQPKGVLYTSISREHTQVLGKKNSFEQYVKAKTLLSKDMMNGVVIVNTDDPNTCNIGLNKQEDGHVIYYGLETDMVEDVYEPTDSYCPICGKKLEYSRHYMNQRGVYSCECGFTRHKPDIKVTKVLSSNGRLDVHVIGSVYNYSFDNNVSIDVELSLPLFGIHNVYNTLASLTAYACFTPEPENIESNISNYFNSLDFSILPPGRFEVEKLGDKLVGIGQGDNGDALKVNVLFMKRELFNSEAEFIYCTPDANEEEIFEDHLKTLKTVNPTHITVVPGRVSLDAAEKYYEKIVEIGLNASYYPIEYDFDKRIKGIVKLINESEYSNIIVTGCGEEQAVWNIIKNKIKEENKN